MDEGSSSLLPYLTAVDDHPVQPPTYSLNSRPCSIGRAAGNCIRVERDGVSRQHAVIFHQQDAYHISDRHSSWGTYLNGNRLTPDEPYRLTSNALIGLGSPTAILRFSDPDPTRPPPELADAAGAVLVHEAARQRFRLHGQVLDLPFLAYQLLSYLYEHRGTLCRPHSCIQAVWEIDEHSADELLNRLYRLVSELRTTLDERQLLLAEDQRVRIENHRRRGYLLIVPEAWART